MDNNKSNENNNGDHSSQRTHRHRHRHRSFVRRWIISPLWAVIVLEGFIIGGLAVREAVLEKDAKEYEAREKALGLVINDGKAELEGLRWEFNEYKTRQNKNCLPSLVPFKYDSLINVDIEYVKSVMFMVSGKAGQKTLQYNMALKNSTSIAVSPQFEVVLLNALGNEVGTVRVGYDSIANIKSQILEKGESRSLSGTIELINDARPEFIMIKIKKDD